MVAWRLTAMSRAAAHNGTAPSQRSDLYVSSHRFFFVCVPVCVVFAGCCLSFCVLFCFAIRLFVTRDRLWSGSRSRIASQRVLVCLRLCLSVHSPPRAVVTHSSSPLHIRAQFIVMFSVFFIICCSAFLNPNLFVVRTHHVLCEAAEDIAAGAVALAYQLAPPEEETAAAKPGAKKAPAKPAAKPAPGKGAAPEPAEVVRASFVCWSVFCFRCGCGCAESDHCRRSPLFRPRKRTRTWHS